MTDAEIELLIQRRAHELWEREGRPEDFALRHWLDAERRVQEEIAYAAALRAQGSRMSVADDELEHVVVVPGGLLAPAA